MNLPPSRNPLAAQLNQPPGAPAAGQLQQALQQSAASAAAYAQPAQSQALAGAQQAILEQRANGQSQQQLAQQVLLSRVADLKRMTGVTEGSAQLAGLGAQSPLELLQRIGLPLPG
jgi:hypothetical protein